MQEKGVTEDGMVGWHHQLSGHQFEQTSGDGEGQGSLMCCSPWGRRVGHKAHEKPQQTNTTHKYGGTSLAVLWMGLGLPVQGV